jgi:hypothetical protein
VSEKINYCSIANLGLILAAQARIDGMKVANAERAKRGAPAKYDEAAFMAEAEELARLGRDTLEWGWQ